MYNRSCYTIKEVWDWTIMWKCTNIPNRVTNVEQSVVRIQIPDSRIHNPDFICYLKNKETRESSCWNTILRDVYLTCIEVRDILVMGYTAVEYKDSNVTCDTHWYICITIDVYTYRSMALYIDGRTTSWDNADVEIRAKQKYARVTKNTNKLEIN